MLRNEAELIRRCCYEDVEARAALVDAHQALVYSVARHMLGNEEEVRDVFQTVFLRLFQHLERIDPERGVSAWLRKTTLNECFDRIKARSRRPEPVDESHVAAETGSPQQRTEKGEVDRALSLALEALSPEQRATVVLHYMEGLRYAEIAEALDVSIETVRSRLKRARAELRKRLRKYY